MDIPQPGDRMTRYQRADGQPFSDEVAWVSELAGYLEHEDEPVQVVRVTSLVLHAEHLTVKPHFQLCIVCTGDGEIETKQRLMLPCPRCDGDGQEPF